MSLRIVNRPKNGNLKNNIIYFIHEVFAFLEEKKIDKTIIVDVTVELLSRVYSGLHIIARTAFFQVKGYDFNVITKHRTDIASKSRSEEHSAKSKVLCCFE